jgi:predicted kinase
VPSLIVLNGPPGIGKSELARRYVGDHPLALNLDIDVVRELLGQWAQYREQAGLLVRQLALGMARAHLLAGFDVVIPQYLGRLRFLEELDALAGELGIVLREFVLLDTRENSLSRWATRQALDPTAGPSTEAADLRNEELTGELYDRLLSVLQARPAVVVIRSEEGRPAAAYQALLDGLDMPGGGT